uniref:Lebercilin domain-containing protein n=1 Tax=Bracon brevicornis TaxID=1563983 RepID=A0A6V7IYR5_9HYME
METEVRSLKLELTRTREDLKLATKRCRELVRELDTLATCHESEKNLRDQQLSKILRALLILESRLRQEQKSIRQQLCEKDNVIKNQQIEIAKLRRYTKNYIKNKRDSGLLNKSPSTPETIDNLANVDGFDGHLANDIQKLKREIITKFNVEDEELRNKECTVRKTDSFAESDVSKESLTSSENTDGSIVTTTTDGSPSLLSTEGFCEGESTDVSPGSTLNKSSRRSNSDSDSEATRTVLDNFEKNSNDELPKRRIGVVRNEPLVIYDNEVTKIARSDSKDDGMDCNFVSDEEEEEDDGEPIYVNSCNEHNARNLRESETTRFIDDSHNNNNNSGKIDGDEKISEETSGNWYSDPDEDRLNDDIIRHNSYRPNSNHNSVLECVNQILLRDMEEEENNVLTVSRKFKHRGRIVSFQPARLSDIESVGSEMERRNSEEVNTEKDGDVGGNFEATGSEDEFGMRINHQASGTESNVDDDDDDDNSSTRAIPIVIIEPEINENKIVTPVSPDLSIKSRSSASSASPILRLERIEEKTCLSMSSKGLTIAKNLDYEDIESLSEIASPLPKTPPALPPKPQFINNTLVLKKIPSPSFLIDETRKKSSTPSTPAYVKRIFGTAATPIKTGSSVRNLFKSPKTPKSDSKEIKSETEINNPNDQPRVGNMVKHFEEFKIGGDDNSRKNKDRKLVEVEEIDIRQNFEEFNLDECDLSEDPDRLEGDGSERLNNGNASRLDTNSNKETHNAVTTTTTGNGIYDHFLEATGLSTKSILTPSRLLSNHKSMLKPKDIKYKNKIKASAILEKHGGVSATGSNQTQVRHWTGPFV